MTTNRRQFLLASGVAIAGAGAISGPAGGETSDAPTAENPSNYDYPTSGTDSDTPVATVYGGFDCPYTAEMVEDSFADIVEEFVDSGRLRLTFRALEYDENGDPYISNDGVICGQAAGGVWQEDPEAFWDFFAEVWKHQPGDMSEPKIEQIMKDAGVDNAEYIADNLENWDPELRETADDAQEEGVEFTPTIELKGDLGNKDDVVEWIERRLDDDGGESDDDADESDESDQSDESDESDDSEEDQQQTAEENDQDTSGNDDDSDDSDDDDSDDSDDDDSDDSDDDDSDDSDDDDSDDSDDDSDGGDYQCSPDDDGDAQASQSFVFPEASGSRRTL